MDKWTEMIDTWEWFDVLYFDFRKAFDTVSHARVLNKLIAHGIDGSVWLDSRLS